MHTMHHTCSPKNARAFPTHLLHPATAPYPPSDVCTPTHNPKRGLTAHRVGVYAVHAMHANHTCDTAHSSDEKGGGVKKGGGETNTFRKSTTPTQIYIRRHECVSCYQSLAFHCRRRVSQAFERVIEARPTPPNTPTRSTYLRPISLLKASIRYTRRRWNPCKTFSKVKKRGCI